MTRGMQYFAGFCWLIPAIWLLSLFLLVEEAGWDDSIGHLSEPLWLRIGATIVFPLRCLSPLVDHLMLSDRILSMICMPILFLNSFLWAFLFVFLCRFVARFGRAKKKDLHDAA
jgi:hypothetical protein